MMGSTLVDWMFSIWYLWGPFVLMGAVLSFIRWLKYKLTGMGSIADDYDDIDDRIGKLSRPRRKE